MEENLSIVRRSVALEPVDDRTVRALARYKGLGVRGYSAALRMIIREWREFRQQASLPIADVTVEDAVAGNVGVE